MFGLIMNLRHHVKASWPGRHGAREETTGFALCGRDRVPSGGIQAMDQNVTDAALPTTSSLSALISDGPKRQKCDCDLCSTFSEPLREHPLDEKVRLSA